MRIAIRTSVVIIGAVLAFASRPMASAPPPQSTPSYRRS